MNVAPASKDMNRATDEGSRAMERVVYNYHLPEPFAFDPNPRSLKCVCLCAGPNRGVFEKPCMQVMSSFTHKHAYKCACMHILARVDPHIVHIGTDGKLNGKMFLSLAEKYLQNCTSDVSPFCGELCEMVLQFFLFYQIMLFKIEQLEKKMTPCMR